MSQHPPTPLLRRFVSGDLPDSIGVELALHLDDCPACSAQVTTLEPLSHAFASVDDPELPPGLLESVLEAVEADAVQPLDAPARWVFPRAEVLTAGVLMALAAVVLLALGDPAGLAMDVALGASAFATGVWIILEQLASLSPMWMTSLALAGFAACVLLAMNLAGRRPSLLSDRDR
jgi:anti-sigma factor RsiW